MYGFPTKESLQEGKPLDVYLLGTVLYELITLQEYDPNEECLLNQPNLDVSKTLVDLNYWLLNKVDFNFSKRFFFCFRIPLVVLQFQIF
jgi:hypothetical protein